MESRNLLVSAVSGNWEVTLSVHRRIQRWIRNGTHTLAAQYHRVRVDSYFHIFFAAILYVFLLTTHVLKTILHEFLTRTHFHRKCPGGLTPFFLVIKIPNHSVLFTQQLCTGLREHIWNLFLF